MTPVNYVACVNKSTLPDADIALIVEAYRQALPRFCADWSLPVPGLAFYGKDHQGNPAEEAAIIFVNALTDPGALAYHEKLGARVISIVGVDICMQYGEPISRAFGHELFEMIADPDLDRWAGPMADGSHFAVETVDPVQRWSRTVTIDDPILGRGDVEVAEYVTPAWFYPAATQPTTSAPVHSLAPLTDAPGGYHVTEKNGVTVTTGEARIKSYSRLLKRLVKGRA